MHLACSRQALAAFVALVTVGSGRAATFTVTNTASAGVGSLSAAIASANVSPGANVIVFNIPGGGVQSIPGAAPKLTGQVTIDGTTQPGYAGTPLIQIFGGLKISGSFCQLLGLALGTNNGALGVELDSPGVSNLVAGCFIGTGPYGTNSLNLTAAGIYINGSPGNQIGGTNAASRNLVWAGPGQAAINLFFSSGSNTVQGNWIGVDPTGTNRLPGAVNYGIQMVSAGNLIGGAVAGAGNVVVGSTAYGIYANGFSAAGNIIQGNRVGVDPSGTLGLGNGSGIGLLNGARSNLVGGTVTSAGNITSSNHLDGIAILGLSPTEIDGNVIQGNLIGTDATGLKALPNGSGLFVIDSRYNLIGGSEPGAGNVISGNGGGLTVEQADFSSVQGNFIGVDATGTAPLPNGGTGLFINGNSVQVGGPTAAAGNVISANGSYGFYIYGGNSNVIQGNYIGTDATGQTALGNTYDGISLDGANETVVGGPNNGEGNVIAASGTDGIALGRYLVSSNVTIIGNTIGLPASPGSTRGSVSRAQSGGSARPTPLDDAQFCIIGNAIECNLVSTDCPPHNLVTGNTLCSCGSIPLQVTSATFSQCVNTYICASGGTPVGSAGPPPPILSPGTGGIGYSLQVRGAPGTTVTVTLYAREPQGNSDKYIHYVDYLVGIGSDGTGSLGPLVPMGAIELCGAVLDACGHLSAMSVPLLIYSFSGPPVAQSSANFVCAGFNGCPVSTFNGELYDLLPPDLSVGGPMPLRFQRYYAALLQRDGFAASRLGDNWLHNFEARLLTTPSNVVYVVTQFGRVVPFTNSAGIYALLGQRDIPFQLTNNGSAYVFGDPNSQRLYTFDNTGALTKIADGRGNAHTLTYASGLLTGVSDGLGHSLAFHYNVGGQLTNVTDGVRSVGFAQTGSLLTQASDALGNLTTYSYDTNNAISGLLTAATQPEGNAPFTQTFNTNGQVVTQIEAGVIPGTNSFTYAAGAAVITDPFGNLAKQTNNAAGQLVGLIDEAGQTSTLGYNADGQRSVVTDRLGQSTLMDYHPPSGKIASLTNAAGSVVTFTYTNHSVSGIQFYDPAQIGYADGTTESFAYDSVGNLLVRTDRAGQVWTFSYNGRGQVLTATNPAGGGAVLTYNPDGTLASRVDSDTGLTAFFYDQFRRLTNVVHSDASSFSLAYDTDDRLVSTTDELGRMRSYGYDHDSNLRQITDPLGFLTQFNYDPRNRLRQIIDRLGAVTSLGYDARGDVVSNSTPTGDVTLFAHDSRHRLTATTDPAGNVWTRGYDNEALLISAANPLNQTNTLARNGLGSVTNAADALKDAASFTRDAMQRVTLVLDPLARSNNYAYDPHDRLAAAGRQGIGTASYQRNSLGLLSQITDLNSNTWKFTYTPMGRLQSVSDPLNRTRSLAYDSRGRPRKSTFADGTTRTNVFDAANNLVQRQYSAGPVLAYNYDALNRLTSALDLALAYDPEGRVTNTLSSGVNFGAGYDPSGRLTNAAYYNGTFSVRYSYDRRGLLTNVTDTLTGVSISFTYDAAGRLTGVTRPNGVNGAYTYDAAGRLNRIQEGSFLDLQFTLDAAGQIVMNAFTAPLDPSALLTPALQVLHYDAAHQIIDAGYAFDARGRQTAAPAHNFAWDGASRLTGIDGVALGYNGLSQIETRTQGGVTHRYFYNHAVRMAPIMADRNESTGQVELYYVWTPGGRLLYLIDALHGNAVYYFHFDQVGSTLALTAAGGNVTDAYAYSAYGVLLGHTGTNTQPFTYIGAYGVRSDPAASLYHMRARYYDPATARFLSLDSIWPRLNQPSALNPYQYASQKPAQLTDPGGRYDGSKSDYQDWRDDWEDLSDVVRLFLPIDITGHGDYGNFTDDTGPLPGTEPTVPSPDPSKGDVASIVGTDDDRIYYGSPSPYDKPETPPSPPSATQSSPFSNSGIPGFSSMILPRAFKPTSLILPAFSLGQPPGPASIPQGSATAMFFSTSLRIEQGVVQQGMPPSNGQEVGFWHTFVYDGYYDNRPTERRKDLYYQGRPSDTIVDDPAGRVFSSVGD